MSNSKEELVHSLGGSGKAGSFTLPTFLIIVILAAGLGGAIGYLGSTFATSKGEQTATSQEKTGNVAKSQGVLDKKKFPDKAEGLLKDGGIEGEGSFHLERPGGDSQNVYLTSSTVDLSSYIGKKVRVLGQTQTAKKAGWLMDVGYVEIL